MLKIFTKNERKRKNIKKMKILTEHCKYQKKIVNYYYYAKK